MVVNVPCQEAHISVHVLMDSQDQPVHHITHVKQTNVKMEELHNQMVIYATVYVQHFIVELSVKLIRTLVQTIHV
jgi:hypothetical protein